MNQKSKLLSAFGSFSVALALMAGATPVFAQLDFTARRDLGVGATPRGMVVGDLNGDGKKDIIVANSSSDSISILLGSGGGVFRPESRKSTATNPYGLVLASFNSSTDAFLDVATACLQGDQVQIFPGNGAGGLGLPTSFATGLDTHPIALAALDYNLDGKQDLVVLLNGSNEVRLYQGNGLSGFSLVAGSTVGVPLNPVAMSLADFDQDGKLDLAILSQGDTSVEPPPNSTVTVLYGCPTGFCFPASVAVAPFSETLSTGLLNNDIYPDLVVTSSVGTNVSLLYGDPDFGFTTVIPLAAGGLTFASAVGDFTGDSKVDIALATQIIGGPVGVKIFSGDGFGTFTAGTGLFPVGSPPSLLLSQDLGGSTALDLLSANIAASTVSLLMGAGNGTFTTTPAFSFGAGTAVSGIDAGDVNADSKLDLAVTRLDQNQVALLLGSGTGTFSAGAVLTLPGNSPGDAAATALRLRNFTSDSLLDIVTLDAGPEQLSFFPGTGPGTFGGRNDLSLGNNCNTSNGAGCINPENLATGPLNDTDTTHPDLIVMNSGGDSSFPYGSISVFLQNGSGFAPVTRYAGGSGPICVGGVSNGLACASNTDCRGRCSVANTTPCSDDIDCPSGQTCTNPAPGTCELSPTGAAIGTIDADANRDVQVCEAATAKATFLPGNGTGAYASVGASASTGTGPRHAMLKDLDGDGDVDLITVNNGDSTVSSFLGNNTGSFTPVGTPISGGQSPWRAVLGDFNLDGWDDVIVNNITSGSLAVLLGDGLGHFGQPIRFGVGQTPRDLVVGDYNGDGKPDLAVTNEGEGSVSILLNQSQDPSLTMNWVSAGAQVFWSPFFEAGSYDVIRGDRSQITQNATQVSLGTVVCIENDSPNTDTIGNEDGSNPPIGGIYFYLFRTQDAQIKGSYGRSSLGKLRVPASGDCL